LTITVVFKMNLDRPEPCPQYWELLNDADKIAYKFLRQTLASPSCKNRRNRSVQTFSDIIAGIKAYVIRGNDDDAKRALVCGVCWLDSSIAINTRQLRLILSKCKSSINGSFQQLGYGTIPTGADSASSLIRIFPFLENNFAELRQWTVRQLISQSPQPSSLPDFFHQAYTYPTPPPDISGFTQLGYEIRNTAPVESKTIETTKTHVPASSSYEFEEKSENDDLAFWNPSFTFDD